MTPVKSGNFATLLDAPVSVSTANKLKIIFSGIPASTQNGNLWIDIDVNLVKGTALFHCLEKESVGDHPNRKVTYRANQTCRLRFSDKRVFNREYVDLTVNKKELVIDDDTHQVDANYEIEGKGVTVTAVAEEMMSGISPFGGPHIVVP
jgi:hypothetical protein